MSLGIEKIKDVLAFPLALHVAYEKANADGNLGLTDLMHLVDPVRKLPRALSGAKGAVKEIEDLDSVERDILMQWVAKEYDIADDVLEKKVEAAFEIALSIAKFVGVLKEDEEPRDTVEMMGEMPVSSEGSIG